MTSVNKQNIPDTISPEINEKIDAIILPAFDKSKNTKAFKKQVFDALTGDKKKALLLMDNGDLNLFYYLPDTLKNDPEIVAKAIVQNPRVYMSLSLNLKQNIDIQKEAISWLIANGGNITDLIEVLEINPKNRKKIQKHLDELLEKNKDFLSDPLLRLLYEIYIDDKKFYDLMKQKWLLSDSNHWVSLWLRCTDMLAKVQQKLKWHKPEEVQNKLFLGLLWFLSISDAMLTEKGREFLMLLISQIKIIQKVEDEDEDGQIKDVINKDETEDEEEDKWDLTVWPYHYAPIWNSCRVWDTQGTSIVLENKKFESMNEVSLKNYMNFSKMLHNLWLGFLIDTQEKLIQIATNIDFYAWEGMSEWKVLKFFNSIGKNIGEPKKSFVDGEGNKATGYFDTIWAAKKKFQEIRDSQKVWNVDFSLVNRWNKSVVEIYMKSIGLLVEPFGEISIAKWNAPFISNNSSQSEKLAV